MKKYFLLFIVLISIPACKSGPSGEGDQEKIWSELDHRLEIWNVGRMERNPDILREVFWEDCFLIIAGEDGEKHFNGIEEVSGRIIDLYHEFPMISETRLPPPERHITGEHREYIFHFENREQNSVIILVFEQRNNDWRIIHQRVERIIHDDMSPIHEELIEIADMDNNGELDDKEQFLLEESLSGPHPVESEIDFFLDRNQNGEVDHEEIIQFRRILREREEIIGGAVFPIITEIDKFLDLNGDGRVQENEIRTAAEAVLIASRGGDIPGKLRSILDQNNDGHIEKQEIIHSMDSYFRPHPVDDRSNLDKRLDRDNDGFISPEEIGLAAGVSEEGPIPPFDEFIEEMRWNTEDFFDRNDEDIKEEDYTSEFYKNIGEIQDKKFAVMGISSNTSSVNKETTDGIMVFIENAFVNIGKVSIIDRSNIKKILEEQNFQLSAVVDEKTAVEVGRLTGADIIIVGNISYVGEIYYLNIKLINVTTGEIMGSSISDCEGPKKFLDMCNDAVYKLF